MKNYLRSFHCLSIFILLLISTSELNAQNNTSFACAYTPNNINEKAICDILGFRSRPEARAAVEDIVRRSGLKQNFYVMECSNIDNCFAVTRNGERMIVYDGSFMRRVNNIAKTDWGALSILAHEIGHHLNGHTLKPGGSDPKRELEADEFAGFVLYQMGASLKEAQSAIWKLTSDYDTGTHPPRRKRMTAIETGYKNAQELYPRVQLVSESKSTEKQLETTVRKGCIKGTCIYGYGIAINTKTGEKYSGNWKNGRRSGYGMEFYTNGKKKYEGNFLNGKFHGYGSFFYKNGDKYIGRFKHGLKHDQRAAYYYKNGDRLLVPYMNDKKQGKASVLYYGGYEKIVYFDNGRKI